MARVSLATPTLTTDRLRLRPFAGEDAASLFALHSDATVLRYWDSPPWAGPERAEVFLAVRWHQRFGDLPAELHGRTVGLHTTDGVPTSRRITLRPDGSTVDAGGPADVDLRAPAPDVLLALWRRRGLDTVTVEGDRALAEHLLDVARF